MRKQGEVPSKEGSKQNYSSFNSTSIQHLYQLLAKNTQSPPESLNEITNAERRSSLPRDRHEQFRVNIHYLKKDEREERQQVLAKAVQIPAVFQEMSKRRKQSVRQNKSHSVQATNRRLKSIILGYRPEEKKKHSFFSSLDEQSAKGESPNSKAATMMEVSPRICIKTQASGENDEEADKREKNGFNSYLYNYKQSIKLRPIQYYVRRTKNKKLSIMGVNMEPRQRAKKPFNKTLQLEEVEISLLNTQSIIGAHQSGVEELAKKKNLSNLGQMKKKSSAQSLLSKCLPYLMASEHVLRKVDAMIRFYHIFTLSFACFLPQRDACDLPKFHKKNVKLSYFVGGGNNRQLIAQLMEKRWWWKQTNNLHEAKFIWSQQKLKQVQGQKVGKDHQILTDMKEQMAKVDRRKRQLGQFRSNTKLNNLFLSSEQAETEQKVTAELTPLLQPQRVYNHLQFGKHLGNKKSLFSMLKLWFLEYKGVSSQLFSWIPQTYHIDADHSSAWEDFNEQFLSQGEDQNIWIVKPGENSNRGRGIFLTKSLSEIKEAVQCRDSQGASTLIIQKYMSNLLLYNGRKFDIRAYLLCVTIGGAIKYFWYSEGYLRTSSHPFSLRDLNVLTHLTNDAIQSQGELYGKHEKGNKLSYAQLQAYVDEQHSKERWKVSDLLKSMKKIAKSVAKVSYPIVNPHKSFGFELFGMDFLVDVGFKPWLLEVNTNPCLELSSPLLQMLIPNLVENVLRLTLDPVFPPTMLPNKQSQYSLPDKIAESNRFELIFDSLSESDGEWEKVVSSKWGQSPRLRSKQGQ